jgi:hypothetical protein
MYGFVLLLMMVIRPKGVIDKNIVRRVVYKLGFKKGVKNLN